MSNKIDKIKEKIVSKYKQYEEYKHFSHNEVVDIVNTLEQWLRICIKVKNQLDNDRARED